MILDGKTYIPRPITTKVYSYMIKLLKGAGVSYDLDNETVSQLEMMGKILENNLLPAIINLTFQTEQNQNPNLTEIKEEDLETAISAVANFFLERAKLLTNILSNLVNLTEKVSPQV